MSTTPVPFASLAGNTSSQIPDDMASASPILQALLSQSGGQQGLQNTDSLVAANPFMGQALSLMSPGGGLSPQQSQQFGPLFALMMSLNGGQPNPGGQ
jgi:hypothetical protein